MRVDRGRVRRGLALALVVAVSGCALDESGTMAVRRPVDSPLGLEILFGHCDADSGIRLGTDRLTDIEVLVESEPTAATTTSEPLAVEPTEVVPIDDFGRREFDQLLWSVHAERARSLDSVRIGTAPEGFATVIPLEAPLPERLLVSARSTASDRSDAGVAELSVLMSNVPADGTFVLDENGTTTVGEFLDRVRTDECDVASSDGGRSTVGSSLTSLLLRLLLLTGGTLALIAAVLVWRRRGDVDPDVDGGRPP